MRVRLESTQVLGHPTVDAATCGVQVYTRYEALGKHVCPARAWSSAPLDGRWEVHLRVSRARVEFREKLLTIELVAECVPGARGVQAWRLPALSE